MTGRWRAMARQNRLALPRFQAHPNGYGQSTADITYVLTALAPAGEERIAKRHGWPEFLRLVQRWETSLNNFLLRL